MTSHRRVVQGFTLVEILIVVVLLGILAAIVIPQFTSASESAKESNLETQLRTVRSQLELYKIQHDDTYPTLAQMFLNLTESTNAAGATTGTLFGPYLLKDPVNPFTVGTTGNVVVANGAAASTNGWTYNVTSGEFRASLSAAQVANLNLPVQDYETY